MRFPKPALREYTEFTGTVLLTMAGLQYAGIFFDNPGTIDRSYLVGLGVALPICAYVWTLLVENVRWLPNWNRMSRTEER